MSDEAPAGESGSGGPLREKFEAARKVALDLTIQAYPGLKPQDFNGVDPDQFVTHATTLKQQRMSQLAEDLGVSMDDLPAALARARGEQSPAPEPETPQARTANLGSLGGRPASFDPQGDEDRGLWGADLIEAALAQEAREKR
jgi:hypothetical protein